MVGNFRLTLKSLHAHRTPRIDYTELLRQRQPLIRLGIVGVVALGLIYKLAPSQLDAWAGRLAFTEMKKPAKPWKRSRGHCRKCGVNTGDIGEYYMVTDELWQGVIDRWKIPTDEYGQVGMICIGCFEQLLGRRLTSQDFIDCEVNRLDCGWNIKSDRLCERIYGPDWRDLLPAIRAARPVA